MRDWFLEISDLTIRSKAFGKSDLMADYRGNIICDLKHGLGIGDKKEIKQYLYGKGARQHAWNEVIEVAEIITDKDYSVYKI